MTKQNIPTTSTAAPAIPLPVPTTCGHCAVEERWFLHHVRLRGIFRRLCTTCVLRLNPQSFCPTCLLVYNPSPCASSSSGYVSCVKCSSYSHNSCVSANPGQTYICPLCLNPNSPVFSLKKGKDVGLKDDDSRVIDKKAAKILLAAATIAADSISKAALAARAEAERRAKEAAFTRKRAREALEHIDFLMARDKVKKKDVLPLPSNGQVSGVNNRGSNQCLSMVVAAVPLEVENVGNNVDKLDGSSEVLVALNAVHLKGQNPAAGLPPVVNGSAMDVEANGGAMVSPISAELVQNHSSATRAEDEKPGELECGNAQREMVNDGTVPVQDNQDQLMGNSDAGEANGSLPQQ